MTSCGTWPGPAARWDICSLLLAGRAAVHLAVVPERSRLCSPLGEAGLCQVSLPGP